MKRRSEVLAAARSLWVPVACYLAVTLLLPLLHGAATTPGFWGHAAWVILGCAAGAAGVAVLALVVRRVGRRA